MPSISPRITGIAIMAIASTVASAATFHLSSPQTPGGHFLPAQTLSASYGFGCHGGNLSPEFQWSHPPAGTKSFALNIFDKDAPTGMGWIQWQVVNIPGNQLTLPTGFSHQPQNTANGILETRTDYGVAGYAGPCPPSGQLHHYVVTLTALKVAQLPGISAASTPAMVGYMVNANALGKTQLTITAQR